MMNTEEAALSLKWGSHCESIRDEAYKLLKNKQLVDLKLTCEGRTIEVHKFVLSICSPYFKNMFNKEPAGQNSTLFFVGTSFTELYAMVVFMYTGEVQIEKEKFETFMKLASSVQIKGLYCSTTGDKTSEPSVSDNQTSQNVIPIPAVQTHEPDPEYDGEEAEVPVPVTEKKKPTIPTPTKTTPSKQVPPKTPKKFVLYGPKSAKKRYEKEDDDSSSGKSGISTRSTDVKKTNNVGRTRSSTPLNVHAGKSHSSSSESVKQSSPSASNVNARSRHSRSQTRSPDIVDLDDDEEDNVDQNFVAVKNENNRLSTTSVRKVNTPLGRPRSKSIESKAGPSREMKTREPKAVKSTAGRHRPIRTTQNANVNYSMDMDESTSGDDISEHNFKPRTVNDIKRRSYIDDAKMDDEDSSDSSADSKSSKYSRTPKRLRP